MVPDALEMAGWSRGTHVEGLRWFPEIGATPIGTVGDSIDALADNSRMR